MRMTYSNGTLLSWAKKTQYMKDLFSMPQLSFPKTILIIPPSSSLSRECSTQIYIPMGKYASLFYIRQKLMLPMSKSLFLRNGSQFLESKRSFCRCSVFSMSPIPIVPPTLTHPKCIETILSNTSKQ